MSEDYKKWEADCKKIRKENKVLLNLFQLWLKGKGLKKTTINNHVGNVDFYINDFLLYSDIIDAKDGANSIGMFLGDWFIRKATWASAAEIKSNAASLKKFYTFLLERGEIVAADLLELKQIIKEEMPDWVAQVEREFDGEWDDIF